MIRDEKVFKKKIFAYNTFFYKMIEECIKGGNFDKCNRVTKRAKVKIPSKMINFDVLA